MKFMRSIITIVLATAAMSAHAQYYDNDHYNQEQQRHYIQQELYQQQMLDIERERDTQAAMDRYREMQYRHQEEMQRYDDFHQRQLDAIDHQWY